LVIDEAAHVEGLEELWTGLYPTLSTGGRCIALSTPNGVGNWFHEACIKAESGENDFNLTILPWEVHPDRDQEWFDKETKNMSRRQIAQELECNFNMSGETVFSSDSIQWVKDNAVPPKYRTGFDRNYWIWKEYDPTADYLVSADVARGDGKDYSVFHIIRIDTCEVAAEYKGKLTPDAFSEVLITAGKEYGNAMLVVENNTVGYAVLEKLINRSYPNIYYSKKGSHEYVEGYIGEHMTNAIPGFSTTQKTRPLVIAKMEEFVRNKLIKIYSKRMIAEMEQFIWKGGRPQASKSSNDDLIMACAIACWVKDTVFAESVKAMEYSNAFINCMVRNPTKMNTTIPGMHGYAEIAKTDKQDQYREYSWLLKG
jgi:hypothetical protein